MVFKLLIVIVTLLVINNGAQRFNRLDIDPLNFDKYNFLEHLTSRTSKRDGATDPNDDNDVTARKTNHPFCPSYYKKCNGKESHKPSSKRFLITFKDFQNFIRSIPREIRTDEYEENNIVKNLKLDQDISIWDL